VSTIGNEVISRAIDDSETGMQVIYLSETVNTTGIAKSWKFYSTSESSELYLQIWRPINSNEYKLISSIKYTVDSQGTEKQINCFFLKIFFYNILLL
jgi:hypothetical protein